jgi:hypothetical protein
MAPELEPDMSRIGAGASSKYRFQFLILFTLQVNGYGSELEPQPEPHNFFMPELHEHDAALVLTPAPTPIIWHIQ